MSPILLFALKALYSSTLGFILGIQREKIGKPAGSRTYALVTLGSAIFTMLSMSTLWGGVKSMAFGLGNVGTVDPTRIAAQIVIGIGFLGAGMIIFHDDKIQGLTTAAGLWVAAAIGMAVGLGMYWEALIITSLVFAILFLGQYQEKKGWMKK